jgi:hypothetical protein
MLAKLTLFCHYYHHDKKETLKNAVNGKTENVADSVGSQRSLCIVFFVI